MRLRDRTEGIEDPRLASTKHASLTQCNSTESEATFLLHPVLATKESELHIDQKEVLPKRKGGKKKRKSAEEKAAKVRARNRRAQQAFRKRQKALSQERNESLAFLEEEVNQLRQTNSILRSTIDQLLQKLESKQDCPVLLDMDVITPGNCCLITSRTSELGDSPAQVAQTADLTLNHTFGDPLLEPLDPLFPIVEFPNNSFT